MTKKGSRGAKRRILGVDITMDDIVKQKISIKDIEEEIDALKIKANLVYEEKNMHFKVLDMSS